MKFPPYLNKRCCGNVQHEIFEGIKQDVADSVGTSMFLVDTCERNGEYAMAIEHSPPQAYDRLMEMTPLSEIIREGVQAIIKKQGGTVPQTQSTKILKTLKQ